MRTLCAALMLGCVFLFAGCASAKRRLEVDRVSKIVSGQTTRAEAENLLGHPKETVLGANGISVARYYFHEFQRSTDASRQERRRHPGDILFRTLTLKYSRAAVVERKLHDESMTPIHLTNAFYFAGPMLSEQSVTFITRDVTKEAEVVANLGEPSSRTFDGEGRDVLVWFSVRRREMSWNNPQMQKLMVLFDGRKIVRDYVLVEHAVSDSEPLTLH